MESLESEGAGPRTIAELLRLRDESLRRPLPTVPAIDMAVPPSNEEQNRIWAAAAESAVRYMASLPDFICTQEVKRYQGSGDRPHDTLRLKLTYSEGKEDHQLLSINGDNTETSYDQLGGATTKGEFASELSEVFASASNAQYRWDHWTTLRNRPAHVVSARPMCPISIGRSSICGNLSMRSLHL